MKPVDMKSEKENKTSLRYDQLNMVLVGNTGSGKSASGNTILGRTQFVSEASASSVTKECHLGIAEIVFEGSEKPNSVSLKKKMRRVQVVDMPGFGDTHFTEEQTHTEIAKCVSLSVPGLHAFLLVVPIGRFTDFENQAACKVAEVFGEDALQHHTIVVFTRGDELEGKEIEKYLEKAPAQLKALIDRCGGRYHVLNNKDPGNKTQVKELIEKIDKMQCRGLYTNAMFREAEAAIKEERERRSKGEKQITPIALSPEVIERVKIILVSAATGMVVGALFGAVCPVAFAVGTSFAGKSVGIVAGSAGVMKTGAAVGATGGAIMGGFAGCEATSCKEGASKAMYEAGKVGLCAVGGGVVLGAASAALGAISGGTATAAIQSAAQEVNVPVLSQSAGPASASGVSSLLRSVEAGLAVATITGGLAIKIHKGKDSSTFKLKVNASKKQK